MHLLNLSCLFYRSDRLQMTFDPQTLSIPEVSHRTARFLGVPLPPCFRIAIITRSLAGWLKPQTGEVIDLGREVA